MKALELSKHYLSVFRMFKGSHILYRTIDSIIGDGILTKFILLQAFIVVLLICKIEYDLSKIESTREAKKVLSL